MLSLAIFLCACVGVSGFGTSPLLLGSSAPAAPHTLHPLGLRTFEPQGIVSSSHRSRENVIVRQRLEGVKGLGAALSAPDRTAELILKEVKRVDGVDINIKLEGLGGNKRRISGGLFIEAPPRAIWDVLTNYNQLSEYIPNIAASGAVIQPNGKVRIEQVGVISPTLKITTRIVLEVNEEPYKKVTFSKVESREFLEFEGTYTITEDKDGKAYLEYSVEALPLPILPIMLVQGKIKKEVPPMLAAVRTNANKYHSLRVSTLGPDWMEDVPPPVSQPYRKRISTKSPLPDERESFSVPRTESENLYTFETKPSLPFTSLAAGLLQAVIGVFQLLPGFKPLPGDSDR